MRLKDENGRPYSDKFLRDICVNFILAGMDTSSVALSWFFWLLEQNPEVEENILAEICRIVRQRNDIKREEFDNSLRFRPEEIKKCSMSCLDDKKRLKRISPMRNEEVRLIALLSNIVDHELEDQVHVHNQFNGCIERHSNCSNLYYLDGHSK
ncbi:hypothetical protein ACSQ67_022169 [Phaseolus vulgaris]